MVMFSDHYELDPLLKIKLGMIPIVLSLIFMVVNIYCIMGKKILI